MPGKINFPDFFQGSRRKTILVGDRPQLAHVGQTVVAADLSARASVMLRLRLLLSRKFLHSDSKAHEQHVCLCNSGCNQV